MQVTTHENSRHCRPVLPLHPFGVVPQKAKGRILSHSPRLCEVEGCPVSGHEAADCLYCRLGLHPTPIVPDHDLTEWGLDHHHEGIQAPGPGQLPFKAFPARRNGRHKVREGLALDGHTAFKSGKAIIAGCQAAILDLDVFVLLAIKMEGRLLPAVQDDLHAGSSSNHLLLASSTPSILLTCLAQFDEGAKAQDVENKILRYVIATEGLLIPQKRSIDDIRKTYALRGASLCADNKEEFDEFHKVLLCAHTARSTIAHGSINTAKEVQKVDFTRFEEICMKVLIRAILITQEPSTLGLPCTTDQLDKYFNHMAIHNPLLYL